MNTLLLLSYIVMLSLYAYAFGSYASALFGVESLRRIFSAGVILLFVLVNLRGTRSVGRVEDIIVLLKVSILLLFICAGMRSLHFSEVLSARWPDILSILAGGMIIFLAYEGFELIANAAEEADKKAIEGALYFSVLFVTALYVLTALVAVGNVPLRVLIHARDYALAEAAKPVLGSAGFLLISIAAIFSTASAINATIYGSARVAYTIAAEGELPRVLARSTGNIPLAGLLLVAFGALLVSSTVDLSGISAMGSAGFLIVFTAVNAAAFKLADKINIPRIVPGFAMLLTALAFAVLCIKEGTSRPENVVFLLTLIAASFLIEVGYRFLTKRKMHLRFWSERRSSVPW